jgi:hypothetical protein
MSDFLKLLAEREKSRALTLVGSPRPRNGDVSKRLKPQAQEGYEMMNTGNGMEATYVQAQESYQA